MEWQTIETAPENVAVLVCRFVPGYRVEYVLSPVAGKLFTPPGEPNVWQFYFNSEPIPTEFLPTHWQVLPAPPVT